MKQENYLFIDRDGTLIIEPEDKQVDSFAKLAFLANVFASLQKLKQAGFKFILVTNQDGLGTPTFPEEDFTKVQKLMISIFKSQGIEFSDILICPHKPEDNCECRKPKLGLVMNYMREQKINCNNSWVIGDRETDLQLAENMGINAIQIGSQAYPDWETVTSVIINRDRKANIKRETKETAINVAVNLDKNQPVEINTGIGFFDHMLEQLAKHAGISLFIKTQGDLHIDTHHTIEDTALALGEALNQALGNRMGIARYGFLLPMDETLAQVAIDLGGRPYCNFKANFTTPFIENFATEMAPHFFQSLAQTLKASIHIDVKGDNNHHMIEGCFKAFARTLKQAIIVESDNLPSTKGIL